jgi:hypothetical protein
MCFITTLYSSLSLFLVFTSGVSLTCRFVHYRYLTVYPCTTLGSSERCQIETSVASQAESSVQNYTLPHFSHASNILFLLQWNGREDWKVSLKQCVIADSYNDLWHPALLYKRLITRHGVGSPVKVRQCLPSYFMDLVKYSYALHPQYSLITKLRLPYLQVATFTLREYQIINVWKQFIGKYFVLRTK